MDLLTSLKAEFPVRADDPTDEYIEQNPDPTAAQPRHNWLIIMPAYMRWCIRSPLRNELLVLDHTVNALAEFGRFGQPEPAHLNFRALCNPGQRAVVAGFLDWCLNEKVLVHEEQVRRSLKHWHGA